MRKGYSREEEVDEPEGHANGEGNAQTCSLTCGEQEKVVTGNIQEVL